MNKTFHAGLNDPRDEHSEDQLTEKKRSLSQLSQQRVRNFTREPCCNTYNKKITLKGYKDQSKGIFNVSSSATNSKSKFPKFLNSQA